MATTKLSLLALAAVLAAAYILNLTAGQARSVADDENRYFPYIARHWPPPTATPSPGRLLISEVMYDPIGREPQGEWIEIFNGGDLPLTINNYKIGDAVASRQGEGMFRLPDNLTLQAGEARVVANYALEFELVYGFSPDYELGKSTSRVTTLRKYLAWSDEAIVLSNSGDEVILLNENDQIVDGVSWGSSNVIFYPPAMDVHEGSSLERYPGNRDSNAASDWREQTVPSPRLVIIPPPTPTPTRTPLPTRTPTLTPTPTITLTPTNTPTKTPLPALVINEFQADPHPSLGDANGDGLVSLLGDEFIEIVNITGAAADLSGWQIRNIIGVRHIFSPGTHLANGCGVVVFGGGTPAGDFGHMLVQTASSGSLELINRADTIQLLDAAGNNVATVSYGAEGEEDQSLTRLPDLTGETWVLHSQAAGSGGALYSPGTQVTGDYFTGCP